MTRRVLVLGATGMLGHTLLRELQCSPDLDVRGTARSLTGRAGWFPDELAARITTGVEALDVPRIRRLLREQRPDAVVNCIGVIKQRPGVEDPVPTIAINALLPHQLAEACAEVGARLIQVSTDCVFSGDRGGYTETDLPDPTDLYGRSKLLGETTGEGTLTLRTSIVGHELGTARSLVDWFLGQTAVKGYTKAIYSGVTTVEFARLLRTVILPDQALTGLFHVAAAPIAKYDLLRLVAATYGWTGDITPFDGFVCDRSLSAEALARTTGYRPPAWPEMISKLHAARSRWAAGRPSTR
ncbi:SDR family oxidoreductase [Micromonospora sp. HK10]|uniref:dTDP-4-dehydrorhamnose reductase family protein n=1 Tax=Micromonospora sp. HK10 TaxID=1538294 RepID=UPI00062718F6|nr:SDR family oxidoreductase [Micromonospora sp. HK10]KKK05418.1 dTDP-4-dehydrorhamnose reductase [Micromonospora sp. HK10]